MLYYELQALLQHNCNLAVAYLALVATRYYTITTGCNNLLPRLQNQLLLIATRYYSIATQLLLRYDCNSELQLDVIIVTRCI